jgi:hypothetical protein
VALPFLEVRDAIVGQVFIEFGVKINNKSSNIISVKKNVVIRKTATDWVPKDRLR